MKLGYRYEISVVFPCAKVVIFVERVVRSLVPIGDSAETALDLASNMANLLGDRADTADQK
jgi:hypothetical protein